MRAPACASYFVCRFFIERVMGLKNGLVNLIISFLSVFGIYAPAAYAEHDNDKRVI